MRQGARRLHAEHTPSCSSACAMYSESPGQRFRHGAFLQLLALRTLTVVDSTAMSYAFKLAAACIGFLPLGAQSSSSTRSGCASRLGQRSWSSAADCSCSPGTRIARTAPLAQRSTRSRPSEPAARPRRARAAPRTLRLLAGGERADACSRDGRASRRRRLLDLRSGARVRLVQIDAPELGEGECHARESRFSSSGSRHPDSASSSRPIRSSTAPIATDVCFATSSSRTRT